MRILATMIVLALGLSLGLTACGRKNPPNPPAGYEQPGGDDA